MLSESLESSTSGSNHLGLAREVVLGHGFWAEAYTPSRTGKHRQRMGSRDGVSGQECGGRPET
jgi:hypothetical protein